MLGLQRLINYQSQYHTVCVWLQIVVVVHDAIQSQKAEQNKSVAVYISNKSFRVIK